MKKSKQKEQSYVPAVEAHNGLSFAQAERLAVLAEECGEVIQAVGKILRHGNFRSGKLAMGDRTNRQNLEREIGDLNAILRLMDASQDINQRNVDNYRNEKWAKYKEAGNGVLWHQHEFWNSFFKIPDPTLPCDTCGGTEETNHQRLCSTLYPAAKKTNFKKREIGKIVAARKALKRKR